MISMSIIGLEKQWIVDAKSIKMAEVLIYCLKKKKSMTTKYCKRYWWLRW